MNCLFWNEGASAYVCIWNPQQRLKSRVRFFQLACPINGEKNSPRAVTASQAGRVLELVFIQLRSKTAPPDFKESCYVRLSLQERLERGAQIYA